IAHLQHPTQFKPHQFQAYADLAKAYQQDKQLDRAAEQLDTAIRLAETQELERPVLAVLYQNRARLHLEREDLEAALRDFEQAGAAAPSAEGHAERGRLLQRLKRYPDALAAFDAALQIRPGFTEIHL